MKVELLSITHDAEKVIESAGRTAYQSFDRITDESASKFIQMIIKRGHESVCEHASATFRISDVSRAFSHQLVRHRLASYTQKSQRYCSESDFTYVEPESIKNNEELHDLFTLFMEGAKNLYVYMQEQGIRNEDCRFLLPNAVCTEIIITCNFREWRNIISIRTNSSAQWEIREVCNEILKILKEKAPNCFGDL